MHEDCVLAVVSDDILKRLVHAKLKRTSTLSPFRDEGCGEPHFITCWRSHGACKDQAV